MCVFLTMREEGVCAPYPCVVPGSIVLWNSYISISTMNSLRREQLSLEGQERLHQKGER